MLKRLHIELTPAGDEIAVKGEPIVDTTGGAPSIGFAIQPYHALLALSARYKLTIPTLFLDKMSEAEANSRYTPLILGGDFRAYGNVGIFNAVELYKELALYAGMARLEDLQAPGFRVVYSEVPLPALEFQQHLDGDDWDTVNIDTRADHIRNWKVYKSVLSDLEDTPAKMEEAHYQEI